MVFKWRDSFEYKISAQVAGEECDRVAKANGGLLTASALVNASRPDNAPLHGEFEWDNEVAGERFREEQARSIIRHITVVNEVTEQAPIEIKLYHHLTSSKAYEPITVIMSDEDKRNELLENAKRDMKIFMGKYSALKNLADVFDAMHKAIEQINFNFEEVI